MVFTPLAYANELDDVEAPDFISAFTCESAYSNSKKILPSVQSSYNEIKGLKARFFQVSTLLGMGNSHISMGQVQFLKPGKMNWKYISPSPQDFITDGKKVWYYEPSVNQLTIGELTSTFSSDVPVSFLLGIGKITESFSLKKACKNKEGILLVLEPLNQDQNLKAFSLLVDQNSFLPIGARLVDVGDTSTEFLFRDVNTKDVPEEKEFNFITPDGVDVVHHGDSH